MRSAVVASVVAAGLALCGVAQAQDTLFYSDTVSAELSAPRYFEGLYAGVSFGAYGNEHANYFQGATFGQAYGAGPVVGFNAYVTDGIILGAELQAGLGYDPAGTFRYDLMALTHVGFPVDPYSQLYFTAGAGWFESAPAFAIGMGYEAGVTDNLSVRAEALAFGQLGPVPSGLNIGAISAWQLTGGVLWHLGEGQNGRPQDLLFAPRTSDADFTGAYTNAYFGAILNFPYNFFPDVGNGGHLTRLSFGGGAGWNQEIANNIIAGVELQGGLLFDTSGDVTHDTLALGRIGLVPIDGLFVYAEAGGGLVANKPAFAFGGGLEYALWENASFRADVLAVGELDPAAAVQGVSATKFHVGPVWHFN